ncbi:hypothetical protein UO65_5239 [Actinokineospora spheciospongiae]|uniref:Band 7 domain-containing protein n=1 Tax=Actinokineospora spheciospongiae TaxID=909613 RepID=W7ISW0_9PSEU|nr:hypothetical protein [Actinokineospora spheciospongiae]EWC59511.1 hypothetical protein UO65_5239 [Actinokineospora spheciospongiae]PWW65915.1 hypothetical protein DFQ13_102674 [Actinokineospora spheciospongiae]
MAQPYPIVRQVVLDPLPRKRMFGRGRSGRTTDEIPHLAAHHRLVYRVRGDYVVDNFTMPLDSSTVVDASHVSVVDVARDVAVVVNLTIPSQDASSFTVLATFLCSVTDPLSVVRSGAQEAAGMLRAYLRGHQRLFELGLDYPISRINEIRRKLSTQVMAYLEVTPPQFPGVEVALASVEVMTPEELSALEQSRREVAAQHALESERLRTQHDIVTTQLLQEQSLRADRELWDSRLAAEGQQRELEMDAERREYELFQQAKAAEAIADDPVRALALAYSSKEITAKELADGLAAIHETRRQDRLTEAEAERVERRRETEWQRERERLRIAAHREDSIKRAEWVRADRKMDREDQRQQLHAKLAVIKELAEQGHLATANLRLDSVVNSMLAVPAAPEQEAPALPEPDRDRSPANGFAGLDREADEMVREEDAD